MIFVELSMLFCFGPADIFGGLAYLYDTSPKGGYTKLFGDPKNHYPKATFRQYFGVWLILRTRSRNYEAERNRAGSLCWKRLAKMKAQC